MHIKKSKYGYGLTDGRKDEEVARLELIFFFFVNHIMGHPIRITVCLQMSPFARKELSQ
jgi:hypothetical protein